MSFIDDFISSLQSSNSTANPLVTDNESERDGNVTDLLFRVAQPTVSVQGGTTITSLSPYTAASDLSAGKVSLSVLLWLAIAGFVGWWLLKQM